MSCLTLTQCRPEPGIGLTLTTGTGASSLEAFNNVQTNFAAYRDVFGLLLGKPKSNLCYQATTTDAFLAHMDLASAYKTREVEVLSILVDAAIINSRNNYLTALSPTLLTPEMYFTVNVRNISAMPFTEIAPCGIAEEPSSHGGAASTTYKFTQTVRRYEQSRTIERDLALDENFGSQYWLEILGEFVTNANLTRDMGIITTLIQMGYENMSRSMIEGVPIDVHKLFNAMQESFLLAAVDPELLIDYVRRQEETIPELDTLVILTGKSSYLRGVKGDTQTMLVQKLPTDIVAANAVAQLVEGPKSFKTISLGNRNLDIIEFTPFYLGEDVAVRINPLMTRRIVGQFFPPNPFINPESCAGEKFLCGETTDTRIFQQTKKIGLEQPISLADRLRHSLYWDIKTGKPSRQAHEFAKQQTQKRRQPGLEPWSWNRANPRYDGRRDVNEDHNSNSVPDMDEVKNKTDLRQMKSFRDEFPGLLFNPKTGEFGVPRKWGDFHLHAIPNAYFKMDAGLLEAKLREFMPGRSVEEGFVQLKKLGDALKNAAWTDEYLFALYDKNIPRMITFTGTAETPIFTIQTVMTPLNREDSADQCKFPDAEIVEEAKGNRFGGWDLPDKSPTLLQDYPAGFASGAGILRLAQETLNEGRSLWEVAAREAMDAVTFAETLLTFMKDYVGKSDLINRKLMPPWFHQTSDIAALIDSIIGTEGPTFIGVPGTINFTNELPTLGVIREEIAPDTLLQATVDATNLYLRNAVTASPARIIVNNKTRALACLSNPVYVKMLTLEEIVDSLDGDDHFEAEMDKLIHQLYDYLIALCESSDSQSSRKSAVQMSSILAEAFFDQVQSYVAPLGLIATEAERDTYRLNTILKGMRVYATYFKNDTAMKKFLANEKSKRDKALGGECIDYGEGFIEALKAYEKPTSRIGEPVILTREPVATPVTRAAPVYKADYTVAPTKYIRSPIVSSNSLREYLKDKVVPWILPADARLFYSRPEDPRIITSNPNICTNPHKNQLEVCSLSRRLVFECRLNSKKDDLFGSLRSTSTKSKKDPAISLKSKSALNMGQFLSMGQFRDDGDDACMTEDHSYQSELRRDEMKQYPYIGPKGEVELSKAMEDTEYIGPWRNRLAYMHKNVNRLAQRFFFRALLEAPNNLDTAVKVSNIGGVLLDAIIARPFTELRTSAALAMKRGNQTIFTAIGHSHVQVTKERRGCWHISAGFMMGLIKVRRDNVALIPDAFPEGLIGGKDIDWMTDFRHLSLPNPNKESMVSMLVGADERKFDGPIHIANGPTAFRPDLDYAFSYRKHSAYRWIEALFGPNVIANIDIANMNRDTYATCLNASNILTQGPASYIDPKTGVKRDVEGSGAMGSFIMNMPGVQEVYEGRAKRFPDRQQMYTYVNTL